LKSRAFQRGIFLRSLWVADLRPVIGGCGRSNLKSARHRSPGHRCSAGAPP
jgi:hypothetical protein